MAYLWISHLESMIPFNLIITAPYVSLKLSYMPRIIGEWIGTSGDTNSGKRLLEKDIYNITTFISFLKMGIYSSRFNELLPRKINQCYSILGSLAYFLVYFIITYFYQYILGGLLGRFCKSILLQFE